MGLGLKEGDWVVVAEGLEVLEEVGEGEAVEERHMVWDTD